jgi:hypothetical protein
MTEYKVVLACHRVEDLKAADKAFKRKIRSGLLNATNFQTEINELTKEGWVVVSSNATSYGSDGVTLFALLRKD